MSESIAPKDTSMILSNNPWSGIEEFLASYGITGLFGLILLWHIYTAAIKPENLKIVYGWIWQLLAFPFKGLRKRAIRFKIEGDCTKALKKISDELPEMEIPELKVSWVNEDNIKSKLSSGKAIVKLKFDNDNTRNIIKATTVYVKDAFLAHTKNHLSKDFRKAIDLSVTKKILLGISNKMNDQFIVTQFINENLDHEPEVFEKCEKVEEIDDNGLFTRIMLRELNSFGTKLFGRTQKQEYSQEADEFLQYLYKIATREYDEYTTLSFPNGVIKVGVVLVAKMETYGQHGVDPYLRRIKLGLAQGIKTFYLLARSEKVEILKEVAKDLLQTGNFILVNKAKTYKDSKERISICYCLQVNEDSLLANSLKEIGNSIKEKSTIKCVITNVREHALHLEIGGVEGVVSKQNMGVLEISDARMYFTSNSTVEGIPLEIKSNGVVDFTLKNTNSDPNFLLTTKFTVGNKISGNISYIDDTFIKLDIGHEKVEGIVYREDITPSRFVFLHEKYKIGEELQLRVKGYNYERANIILEQIEQFVPWPPKGLKIGKLVDFKVCKKTKRSFVGELSEGLEGVIPFWELGYFEREIESKKSSTKLDSTIKCLITEIDEEDEIVFLSCRKLEENPYDQFILNNKGDVFDFIISEVTPYGVTGYLTNTEKKFDVHIPKYEMSWNGKKFPYKVGAKKKVSIKGVDKKGDRFVGTFKPVVKHPLAHFKASYDEGQVLVDLKPKGIFEFGMTYTIIHNRKEHEGVLFKGDVSKYSYVDSCEPLNKLSGIPLAIKEIDLEKNRIVLSLRKLTESNNERIDDLDYTDEYDGVVVGRSGKNYAVLITKVWLEGVLESTRNYEVGTQIKVRPALADKEKLILTDE